MNKVHSVQHALVTKFLQGKGKVLTVKLEPRVLNFFAVHIPTHFKHPTCYYYASTYWNVSQLAKQPLPVYYSYAYIAHLREVIIQITCEHAWFELNANSFNSLSMFYLIHIHVDKVLRKYLKNIAVEIKIHMYVCTVHMNIIM